MGWRGPGKSVEVHGGLDRYREYGKGQRGFERTWKGWKGSGGVERAMEGWRGPGKGDGFHGGMGRAMWKAGEVQGRVERASKGWILLGKVGKGLGWLERPESVEEGQGVYR